MATQRQGSRDGDLIANDRTLTAGRITLLFDGIEGAAPRGRMARFEAAPGFSRNHVLCVGDREARADCQCGELIDRVPASASVCKFLFVRRSGMRGCHSPGTGRITAPASSWPQSTCIVQRKRRPTSNVRSMTVSRASSAMVHFREALHRSAAELDPRLCVVAIDLHRRLQPGRVV